MSTCRFNISDPIHPYKFPFHGRERPPPFTALPLNFRLTGKFMQRYDPPVCQGSKIAYEKGDRYIPATRLILAGGLQKDGHDAILPFSRGRGFGRGLCSGRPV